MAETQTETPTEPEVPAIEEAETTETPELQSETEQDGEVEEAAPEEEEIEYEGAKYRIPKPLKGGFMMQSDYTRKTQEVAEQRKAIESERETFAKSMEAHQQHVKELGKLGVFDETLEQYSKVDWATLRAQNPEQANAAFQDYMQLRDQRDRLAEKVNGEIQKRSQDEQSNFAKRYADATAELARDVKGWNQETASKVRDFALENGITVDELKTVAVNPKLSKILHKAWLGEQLVQKQQQAAKTATAVKPATEVTPLRTVGKKPSASAKSGLSDDLSPEEWTRRRNAQLASK